VIIGVCSDKGSPGVTTLAVALGLVWPGRPCLVMECDPSGGVLSFRMQHAELGGLLQPEPTVASLAAMVRLGLPADGVLRFCQPTSLGVAVVPGPLTAQRWVPVRGLWPQIAQELAAWPGTVIADLGRMQPGNAALPVAQAATAVLLLGHATAEGLYGLRDRAATLAHVLGDPGRERPSVAVVVTDSAAQQGTAVKAAGQMLAAAGSPVPVAGFFARDPAGAGRLWAGEVNRKLARSGLISSARSLAETVIGWWPQLAGHDDAATPAPAAGSGVDRLEAAGTSPAATGVGPFGGSGRTGTEGVGR
jgi:hypothetical protein